MPACSSCAMTRRLIALDRIPGWSSTREADRLSLAQVRCSAWFGPTGRQSNLLALVPRLDGQPLVETALCDQRCRGPEHLPSFPIAFCARWQIDNPRE